MKKLLIASLVVLLAANLGFAQEEGGEEAGSAGAAIYTGTDKPDGVQGFNLSKSVAIGYNPDNGGDGFMSVYSVASKHFQGDKIYASTSAAAHLFMKTGDAGVELTEGDVPDAPENPNDDATPGGFTKM